jgi:DNA-binding MarR family transcriptional regulator
MTSTKRTNQPPSATAAAGADGGSAQAASAAPDTATQLTKADYQRLAEVRHALRRFARYTELETRRVGASPHQYLLLLAIKGFPGRDFANITELAERLQVRHNAVIGLVNRAEENGLVKRVQDPDAPDRRVVQVHLTGAGEQLLRVMAEALRGERGRVVEAVASVASVHDAEG